jgi:hypothetical protein
MSRCIQLAAVITALTLLMTGPVQASKPALQGFMPPGSGAHGHSITSLATEWTHWGFDSAASSPLLSPRCGPSPSDPKVWFLPVGFGGDVTIQCALPTGAWLVIEPGGYECSDLEGNGSTLAELTACVDTFFPLLSYIEVTLDGQTTTDLTKYIVTTPVYQLPPGNILPFLLGVPDQATASLNRAYFVVLHPLSKGEHRLRMYDEFDAFDFSAGLTVVITVR